MPSLHANRRQHTSLIFTLPAKIEALRVAVNLHEVRVPLSRGLKHARAALHQAHVHWTPLRHGLEERVVRLAKVEVEQAVSRKSSTAHRAAVPVRRFVVRLMLRERQQSNVRDTGSRTE